jgi:hypothetical protein
MTVRWFIGVPESAGPCAGTTAVASYSVIVARRRPVFLVMAESAEGVEASRKVTSSCASMEAVEAVSPRHFPVGLHEDG